MFYMNVMAKYATIRAFDKPNEGAGGSTPPEDGAPKVDGEPDDTGEPAGATDEKAISDAKKSADDAALAAKDSDDPKLKQEADEKAELLREVMDKKAKLKANEVELEKARKALEAYGGLDPEKVKALVQREKNAEREAAEAKGDFDRVKAMMVEEHNREMEALNAQLEAERENTRGAKNLIDKLTIGNSFGNSDYIRDSLTISPNKARTLYGAHFETKDGDVVAYDKPAGEADRTMLVTSSGNPLDFDAAMARIIDADPDKKGVLRSRAKAGSGSNTDMGKQTPTKPQVVGKSRIAVNLKGLGE